MYIYIYTYVGTCRRGAVKIGVPLDRTLNIGGGRITVGTQKGSTMFTTYHIFVHIPFCGFSDNL